MRSMGSVEQSSLAHTSGIARKGRSFTRVPSLGISCGMMLRRVRSALAYRTEPVIVNIRKAKEKCKLLSMVLHSSVGFGAALQALQRLQKFLFLSALRVTACFSFTFIRISAHTLSVTL
jgi:hypothetical protein